MIKLTCALVALQAALAIEPVVIYYYSQWSIWGRRYCMSEFLKEAQYKGVTHIQYAFHYPDETCKITTLDHDADFGAEWWSPPCETQCLGTSFDKSKPSSDRGNVGCAKKIRRETDIQIGISLGGWTKSADFSHCSADATKRAVMVDSIVEQVQEYGWDFVDLDWEYPYGGGNDDKDGVMHGLPDDWENFKLLVTDLRAKLAASNLAHVGISGAFGQNPNLILGTDKYAMGTPMTWLCENLNFVSLMAYDLMGGWGPQTGWPAPLHHDPAATYEMADKLTIEWQLKTWKEACGANFNKVIMGLPAYAKTWQAVPEGSAGNGMYEQCQHTGSGQPGVEGLPCVGDGSFIDSYGTLETWDIESIYMKDSRCKHYYNEAAVQDFMYCKEPMFSKNKVGGLWFAFDGPEAMYEKVKYARDLGAGGWMFWDTGYMAYGYEAIAETYPTYEKAQAVQTARANGPLYLWEAYDDACWDGWNGRPFAGPVRGERVGITGGSTDPTTFSCNELKYSYVSDNSVDTACVASFCTAACNKALAGNCAAHADVRDCVSKEIALHSEDSISCIFA